MRAAVLAFVFVLLVANTQAQEKDFLACVDDILEIKNYFWHFVDELTTRDSQKIDAAWKALVGGVKTALGACNPFKSSAPQCADVLEFMGIFVDGSQLMNILEAVGNNNHEALYQLAERLDEKISSCVAIA